MTENFWSVWVKRVDNITSRYRGMKLYENNYFMYCSSLIPYMMLLKGTISFSFPGSIMPPILCGLRVSKLFQPCRGECGCFLVKSDVGMSFFKLL